MGMFSGYPARKHYLPARRREYTTVPYMNRKTNLCPKKGSYGMILKQFLDSVKKHRAAYAFKKPAKGAETK